MIAARRIAGLALASLGDRAEEAWLLAGDQLRRARSGEADDGNVQMAIDRGLSFLRRRQRHDGQLRGFLLLPGASTEWITAHVALVLEEVESAQDICRAAAGYLALSLEARGACGYNRRVGFDCDSTAQALLAVNRFGLPYPRAALDWLVGAQRTEGGFPTYTSATDNLVRNGWHAPHPDVTAVVIMALRRLNGPAEAIARGEAWLAAQARGGVLPAYWWSGAEYGLWVQSRAGFEATTAARVAAQLLPGARVQPLLAMLTIAASREGSGFNSALAALLEGQDRDGSWPCAPCLRVTDWRCDAANVANPGTTYKDRRRVFSTAYAVAALSRALSVGT